MPLALVPGILAILAGLGRRAEAEAEAGAKQGVGEFVGNRCWGGQFSRLAVPAGCSRWPVCSHVCIHPLLVLHIESKHSCDKIVSSGLLTYPCQNLRKMTFIYLFFLFST